MTLRLDDLDRDQLLHLVRIMRRDAATHDIVEPSAIEIAEAILSQAREREDAACAAWRAAAATSTADAQAVTRHVEIHGYRDPYGAKFDKARASQRASVKARRAFAAATAERLKAEAGLRRLEKGRAA